MNHTTLNDTVIWHSPYYKVINNGIQKNTNYYNSIIKFTIFDEIMVELINNITLPRKCQLTFYEKNKCLLFSFRLSGTSNVFLSDKSHKIHHEPGMLTVACFSNLNGTVYFNNGTHTIVNVTILLKDIHKYVSKESAYIYDILNNLDHEIFLKSISASASLSILANKIISPTVSTDTKDLFLCGAILEFLSLAIEDVIRYLKHGKIIRLENNDIILFKKIKSYIEENFLNSPSIDEICKKFYINSFKLKNVFKQIYGISISDYIKNNKLNYAYNQFMNTDINVSECAWKIGYTNVSHFISSFYRQFGFTPGECIRSRKEMTGSTVIENANGSYGSDRSDGLYGGLYGGSCGGSYGSYGSDGSVGMRANRGQDERQPEFHFGNPRIRTDT